MTQPQADERALRVAIKKLVRDNSIAQAKFDRRIERLERMRKFYVEKAPLAGQGQNILFLGFVSAIDYATHIMHSHHSLIKKLDELTKGQDDEARTDS